MGSGELTPRRENPDPRSHGTAQTYGGRNVSAGIAYLRSHKCGRTPRMLKVQQRVPHHTLLVRLNQLNRQPPDIVYRAGNAIGSGTRSSRLRGSALAALQFSGLGNTILPRASNFDKACAQLLTCGSPRASTNPNSSQTARAICVRNRQRSSARTLSKRSPLQGAVSVRKT